MASLLLAEAQGAPAEEAAHLLWLAGEWTKAAEAQGARRPPAGPSPMSRSRRAFPDPQIALLSPAECKAARAALEWTIGQMARKAGVSVWDLRQLEKGDCRSHRILVAVTCAIWDAVRTDDAPVARLTDGLKG